MQASGHVGSEIVKNLLQGKKHKVTALTRADGGSDLPSGVQVAKIDYGNPATLVEALRGQDFLIISLSVTAPRDTQSKLVSAAAEAGIQYIMPNEYCPDGANTHMVTDMVLGHGILAVRKQIEELGVSKWVALSCSFWYEWSLPIGKDTYGFDLKNREVVFFDDGEKKIDTSTWPQCGRAVAGLLNLNVLPENENDKSLTLDSFGNGCAYVTSFTVSQKDMLASAMRVTGTKESDWKITYEPSKERWEKAAEALKTGDRSAFARQMYSRIFFPGVEGNFVQSGRKLLNEPFSLPKEDFDEYTKGAVEFAEAGKSWYG